MLANFSQSIALPGVWVRKGNYKMATHDIEKAQATYGGFMTALKWAVPVIALIVLFVVSLIAG